MRRSFVVLVVGFVAGLGGSQANLIDDQGPRVATLNNIKFSNATCVQIQKSISKASAVFFPADATGHYASDNLHYAISSTQASACSVEPGTAQDVGIILQILGKNKMPFAVKGGGHAMNPKFSSTQGVQIAMTRFNQINYSSAQQTVSIGAGVIWDDVYSALDPLGVGVVGGRVPGIGVAGFTLGGGYSWLTNQYGLAIDNVVAYELVFPSGSVKTVTQSDADLFFALKGGYNNFGIVTKFAIKAFPVGLVWGGAIEVSGDVADQISAALLKFAAEVTDPKAVVLPSFAYLATPGTSLASILMFYDGPVPPAGIFDDFLAIPAISTNIFTRSFLSLVQAAPSNALIGERGVYHTVAVETYDQAFLNAVINETIVGVQTKGLPPDVLLSVAVETFLPNILTHGSDSAYPSTRSTAFLPTSLNIAWTSEDEDEVIFNAIKQSAVRLVAVAEKSGQKIENAPLYPNYAIFDTPLKDIYGDNLARLKSIMLKYDPLNVMGQAGGWKF